MSVITINPGMVADYMNRVNAQKAIIADSYQDVTSRYSYLASTQGGRTLQSSVEFNNESNRLRAKLEEVLSSVQALTNKYVDQGLSTDQAFSRF